MRVRADCVPLSLHAAGWGLGGLVRWLCRIRAQVCQRTQRLLISRFGRVAVTVADSGGILGTRWSRDTSSPVRRVEWWVLRIADGGLCPVRQDLLALATWFVLWRSAPLCQEQRDRGRDPGRRLRLRTLILGGGLPARGDRRFRVVYLLF